MCLNEIRKERNTILHGFRKMGFMGVVPFYNVCKNVDVTLNGFQLLEFYKGTRLHQDLITPLHTILETVRYE